MTEPERADLLFLIRAYGDARAALLEAHADHLLEAIERLVEAARSEQPTLDRGTRSGDLHADTGGFPVLPIDVRATTP